MSAPARPRLFVAVELPEDVRTAIHDATAPWRRSLPAFRWTRPDALHLTIAFIGNVDADAVGAIESAVEATAATLAPVPTELTRFGAFPDRGGARVLWVGLQDPDGGLRRVATGTTTALEPFLEADERPYHPHITIARARRPAAVPPAFHDDQVPVARWTIDALTLFRSHLGAGAPRYEQLGRWNLQAERPEVP
jgi:2'-5' RNA ligase